MVYRNICYSSALALAAATLLPMGSGTAQAQDTQTQSAAEETQYGVGEIIVTARRRAETLLDTPIAIAAVSGDALQERGVVTFNELATATPGLNIQSSNTGRSDRSSQAISLRGFTPTTGNAILVASFIDGVPVASTTAITSVADPERIEVLKGPQAAYFGRNTFAGAINVVSRMPGNDFKGQLNASVGTRELRDIQGSVEGALVDDVLMVRLSGRDFSRRGAYRNAADPNQSLGDQSSRVGSLMIVAKPTQNLTFKAFGLLSQDKDGPAASGALFAHELRATNGQVSFNHDTGTLLAPNMSNCVYNGLTDGLSATENRVPWAGFCGALPSLPKGFGPIQNIFDGNLLADAQANPDGRIFPSSHSVDGFGMKRVFRHFHFNLDYEVGDTGITLSSLTGFNKEQYGALATATNYDTSLITNPSNPNRDPSKLPFWTNANQVERQTKDFSQEIRASFDDGGPLTAMVGGSYLYTRTQASYPNVGQEVMSGLPRNVGTTIGAPQQARTLAAFFGATYQVTDKLKLSADARYQRDNIYFFAGYNGLTISPTNGFGLPAGRTEPFDVAFKKEFKTFLPRIIAQYDLTDDVMGYASYSKGANITLSQFNSQVFNSSPTAVAAAQEIGLQPTIDPERLDNYEVGLKGRLFGGKASFQLSAYYARWKNQINQRSVYILDEAPPAGRGEWTYVVGNANAGDVTLKGLELDINASPIDGLLINASGSLNDSSINEYSNPAFSKLTGVIGDGYNGNQLAHTSKYSAAVGLQYGTDINSWDNGSWFMRGDLSYKSRVFLSEANKAWLPARTVVNLRAGITRGDVKFEAFMLNAFNNRGYTSGIEQNIYSPVVAANAPAHLKAPSAFGYVLLGLPDLRRTGVKVSYSF